MDTSIRRRQGRLSDDEFGRVGALSQERLERNSDKASEPLAVATVAFDVLCLFLNFKSLKAVRCLAK